MRRWIAASLVAFSLSMVAAQPVGAGNSGEQLEFIDQLGTVSTVCVSGYNQDYVWAYHCFSTPFTTNMLSGYWWQGQIKMDLYDSGGFSIGSQGTWVSPVPYHDWWCYNDATGSSGAC